jgi:L-seryl-tRNA(Ser) seleniumtransferase
MSPTSPDLLRSLPSVNRLLDSEELAALRERFPRAALLRAVRESLDDARRSVLAGRETLPADGNAWAARVAALLEGDLGRGLRRVINATGIVSHTGLGRSVLPEDALAAIEEEARGYCLLQVDRETGGRSKRDQHCERLVCELTGAEAAIVVNNNAAATMLVLSALAEGREVIISRGQLVEIGGAFRIPDVLRRSGATLVEVGCTNKTHLRDYEAAITESTALIMKVHTSNYRMLGFVSEVPIGELVELGHGRGLPVVDDLGAGALLDLRPFGFPEEPLVQDSVRAGADVITVSADKLIGGPQGGIVLGRDDSIRRIRKHPLARVVRVGKLTLIALEATLRYFLDRRRAFAEHPTTRMLTAPLDELRRRAEAIAAEIGEVPGATVTVAADASEVGSGAYPAHQIPTFVVRVAAGSPHPNEAARRLRVRSLSVFARVKDDAVVLDPRTIQAGEEREVAEAIREVYGGGTGA